jgi:hypothetical protein
MGIAEQVVDELLLVGEVDAVLLEEARLVRLVRGADVAQKGIG